MWRNPKYTCKSCGYVFPKQTAVISGHEGGERGKHVHCDRCGAIVADFLKTKETAIVA
ncbi:MAG: hypothetical protein ACQCN6_02600 [Candidatus Bathyarchaeia archaeon]|jgi:uncharacterized Zn finger protein